MSAERALLRRLVELSDKRWLSPSIEIDHHSRMPVRQMRPWRDDEVSLEHAISAVRLIAKEAAAMLAQPEAPRPFTREDIMTPEPKDSQKRTLTRSDSTLKRRECGWCGQSLYRAKQGHCGAIGSWEGDEACYWVPAFKAAKEAP